MFSLEWPFAWGGPAVSGDFRTEPEDFCVDEELGFELSGSGEHVYLQLQKRGDNTEWLARNIARLAEVTPADVGYAGLKDRHAVTRQWFSVYLPKGAEPDWQQLQSESVQLLQHTRHSRKLRRGDHRCNRFVIRLRHLQGDLVRLQQQLELLKEQPVPNYFGPQRFGIEGGNLELAQRLLLGGEKIRNRQRRGMAMSAARSWLFNTVLGARVAAGDWQQLTTGDPGLDGMPSGPLWGRGRPLSSEGCLALESEVLQPWAGWCDGLEHVGLLQERRPLALAAWEFGYQLQGDDLVVSFALPPGTFATAVLRELAFLKEVPRSVDVL